MLAPGENYADIFDAPDTVNDPRCEECGRSIVTTGGEPLAPAVCPSCAADWDRLYQAGKIRQVGWSLEVVKIEEAA